MATNKHITAVLDGSAQSFTDRIFLGEQIGVANVAGSGAGASVSTVVTFVEPLPLSYTALVQPGQAAAWYISSKTTYGFTVTLVPLPSTATLAAGEFDVVLVG